MYLVLEISDFENEELKEFAVNFVSKILVTITEILVEIVAHHPDFERSSKARPSVVDSIWCQRHFFNEIKNCKTIENVWRRQDFHRKNKLLYFCVYMFMCYITYNIMQISIPIA